MAISLTHVDPGRGGYTVFAKSNGALRSEPSTLFFTLSAAQLGEVETDFAKLPI
jgi:hypothetical protein